MRMSKGVVLISSFVGGAALVWLLGALSPQPAVRKTQIKPAEVAVTSDDQFEEPVLEARGKSQPGRPAAEPPAKIDGDDATLAVLVRDGSVSPPAPIRGARVAVLRDGEKGRELFGLVGKGRVASEGETDPAGRVRLRSAGPHVHLAVSASGYETRTIRVSSEQQTPVTVDLEPAVLIKGRVTDEAGVALADVEVVVAPAGVGISGGLGDAELWDSGLSLRQSARTKSDGAFEFPGFGSEIRFLLRAVKSGYTLARIESDRGDVRLLTPGTVGHLHIKMSRLVFGEFQLVNKRTRRPVYDRIQTLRARSEVGKFSHIEHRAGDPTNDPSIVRWQCTSSREQIELSILLRVVGYQAVVVSCKGYGSESKPREPGRLVVLLEEEKAVPTGTVRLRIPQGVPKGVVPLMHVKLSPPAVEPSSGDFPEVNLGGLKVKLERKVPYRSIRGRLMSDGSWEFPHVPVGLGTLELIMEGRTRVVLNERSREGETVPATAAESQETGVRVTIVDSHGRRLFEVPHRFAPAKGTGGISLDLSADPADHRLLLQDDGRPSPPPIYRRVWPGSWFVSARVKGLGRGRVAFELAAGEVKDVTLTLER